jgi:hypothetical protein
VDSGRRPSADPEHTAKDTEKRRRLIVSVFTAFVIMLVALSLLISAGGIGPA